MSSSVKSWAARGALALPIVTSAALSLWLTRAPAEPALHFVAPAAAAADDDAAPAGNAPAAPTVSPEEMEARMRRRRSEFLASQPGSTINETEAAEALLEQYAPHVWKRLQHMPTDAPMRVKLQRQMMERARDLQRMQQRDPEQFKSEIEQVKLEDEVADLGRQLMRRGEPSPSPASADQDALRKTLRNTIGKLVDVRLRNRDARLARLAKTVASEKEKLAADRGNRDTLIERQFQTVVNNRRPFAPGGAGEGRPAFGAPNGPRRGAGTSRPGNEPKAAVEASPARSPDSTPDDIKSK